MRVDQPNVALLKQNKEHLILQKLEADNDILHGVSQPDTSGYIALVAEDTDVLDRRVLLPDGQNFSLVGSDSNRSTEGGNCDEHILVAEPVEPLPKCVLGEAVHLELEFAVVEFNPIVVHKILAIKLWDRPCLLYTSPSPRDQRGSRMPSSA